MPREKNHAKTQRRKGSEHERTIILARRSSGDVRYRESFRRDSRLWLGRNAAAVFLIGFHDFAGVFTPRLPETLSTSLPLVSHAPNLCAFASLRKILCPWVAVQLLSDSAVKSGLTCPNSSYAPVF